MTDNKLSPQEQAEQEDKKLLTKTNKEIQDIMTLLSDGDSHETAKKRVEQAKVKTEQIRGKSLVFHPYKGKRTPISQAASSALELGDALELMLVTTQFSSDLNKNLQRLAQTRVEVLERLIQYNK